MYTVQNSCNAYYSILSWPIKTQQIKHRPQLVKESTLSLPRPKHPAVSPKSVASSATNAAALVLLARPVLLGRLVVGG